MYHIKSPDRVPKDTGYLGEKEKECSKHAIKILKYNFHRNFKVELYGVRVNKKDKF